jgi:hypothetical protein
MKNVYIKTISAAILICGLFTAVVFTPGCATTTAPDGTTITDTNTINVVSNYLSVAVSEAVAYGLKNDKTNTTTYATLASAALGDVIGGSDYTPGALSAALQKLPAKVLQSESAGLITLSIESLYQIYWASDVQGAVNGQYAAKAYLSALRSGIAAGLNGHAPIPLGTLKRPSPHQRK